MKFVVILCILVIAAFAKFHKDQETYRNSEEACEILKTILVNFDKYKQEGFLEILIVYRTPSSPSGDWPNFSCLYSELFVMRQIDDPKMHTQFDRPFDVAILIQDEEYFNARDAYDGLKMKQLLRPNLFSKTPSIFVTFTRNYNTFKLLKNVMGRLELEKDSIVISVQSPQDEIKAVYYSEPYDSWMEEKWTAETLKNIENDKKKNIQTSLRSLENVFISKFDENERLQGVERKTLDAICETYNWTSNALSIQSDAHIVNLFWNNFSDVNLKNYQRIKSEVVDMIETYEFDGACFLVPLNIPKSFLENISIPFDFPSIMMMIVSTLMTALVWKLLSINSQSNFPFSYISINIFRCTIGLNFEQEHRLSKKEKILLYFFTFSTIFLISCYQSVLIAIMLTETEMSSIQTIEELNNSNTRIHSFLKNPEVKFRDDLVMNLITRVESLSSIFSLPPELDQNLAYFVPCSVAESFVKSSQNFKNGKKFFNILPEKLSIVPTVVHISKFFPHKEKIQFVIEQLHESGIKSYWMKSSSLMTSELHLDDTTSSQFLDFKRMWFPFVVLMIGAINGLVIFICEHICNYIHYERSKRVITI